MNRTWELSGRPVSFGNRTWKAMNREQLSLLVPVAVEVVGAESCIQVTFRQFHGNFAL
jgi:hypothetical protein